MGKTGKYFHSEKAHPICVLKKLVEWGTTVKDKKAVEKAIAECVKEGKLNPIYKLLKEAGAI